MENIQKKLRSDLYLQCASYIDYIGKEELIEVLQNIVCLLENNSNSRAILTQVAKDITGGTND